AAGVAAFFRLLRRSGLDGATAAAWSAVFGLSASQAVFAVFPESWPFSTLGLLLLFGADRRPLSRLAAGAFAFGMAVTNVVAVALAPPAGGDEERRFALRARAVSVVLVLAVAGVLTLLQTSVYAGTAPFWRVGGLNRDDQLSFVLPEHPRDVLARGI